MVHAVDQHAGQPALIVRRELDLGDEGAQRDRIVHLDARDAPPAR